MEIFPSSNGGRRRSTNSSYASSPEFEFWRVRNPTCPQPQLLSADQLFVNGVILPLDLLHIRKPDPKPPLHPDSASPEPSASHPDPSLISESVTVTAPKRWRDMFRKDKGKNGRVKNKEKKSPSQKSRGNSAELNINIWPFPRSRSAGNDATRPRMGAGVPGGRKVNSAPCSRSNSAGESKSSVKEARSPGRAGVHLGRSSPVWQVRLGGSGPKSSETVVRQSKPPGRNKAKVLNVNVPMRIGDRNHLSCRSDEHSAVAVGGRSGGASDDGVGNGGNLFGLRIFFARKIY